jgi:hypothetical protein
MQDNSSLLFQLEQMLHWKKSRSFYAKKLNISEEEVDELMKEIRRKESVREDAEIAAYIDALEERVIEVNNEKGTLKSTVNCDFEPKSDEELAKLHKIDTLRYKISNYWSKMKSNGKFTSSVFATLRKPSDYTAEDFAKFLQNYTPKEVRILHKLHENFYDKETVDVEISIADFHLAKKTLEGESVSTKRDQFLCVVRELTHKVSSCYNIKKIVFPISNDFFHTDNYQNSTTNGTPQDVLVSYDHEYEEGFDILVEAISFLSAMCDQVEVVLVQGNHDRTKSFFLAHALEVFFKDGYNVTFQRQHSTTKSVVLGNTFIGYHHGNCKIEDLPLVFATGSDSVSFGNAKYREVHTGDKHHYMAKEIKGVRIQQMPSLSGTDRWHADNNYVNNIRSGLALVYHKEYGKVAEFESRI